MIFYFSATGNSRYAADYLARHFRDRTVDIAQALREEPRSYPLQPGETVGFVLPTYFYGIPVILHAFLDELQFETEERHYTYLVLTCGAMTGSAGDQFAGMLQDRDYRISAYYSVRMPDNYLPMFNPPPPEKVDELLAAADRELDGIAADIELRMSGNCDHHRGPFPGLITKLLYPGYRRGRKTGKFRATDACISCGKCAASCPCEAIQMKDGRPVWVESQCVFCMGCINGCPTAAIQYGAATKKRRRYQNHRVK